MFYSPEFIHQHIAALLGSFVLLLAAWRVPRLGRALYAALFAWACIVNFATALRSPDVYLAYAPLAILDPYRAFILGPFAEHVTTIVVLVASCQGMIAIALVLGGSPSRLALVAAIIFLLAIAPLGVGSGFPSTLVMAAGAILLVLPSRRRAMLPPLWIALAEGLRESRGRRFRSSH